MIKPGLKPGAMGLLPGEPNPNASPRPGGQRLGMPPGGGSGPMGPARPPAPPIGSAPPVLGGGLPQPAPDQEGGWIPTNQRPPYVPPQRPAPDVVPPVWDETGLYGSGGLAMQPLPPPLVGQNNPHAMGVNATARWQRQQQRQMQRDALLAKMRGGR